MDHYFQHCYQYEYLDIVGCIFYQDITFYCPGECILYTQHLDMVVLYAPKHP
jgi:hypothetical protein